MGGKGSEFFGHVKYFEFFRCPRQIIKDEQVCANWDYRGRRDRENEAFTCVEGDARGGTGGSVQLDFREQQKVLRGVFAAGGAHGEMGRTGDARRY